MTNTFVAIDFETSNSSHTSACEIGLVKVEHGLMTEKFHSLIKPPNNEYLRQNTLINGITPDMTENSPPFNELWPDIEKFIGENLLVAHNISTDLSILRQSLAFYSLKTPQYSTDCTYQIFGASLSDMCQAFGIDRLYHNALIDAEACAIIYLNYLNRIPPDMTKINASKKSNLFDFTGHERIKGESLKPYFDNGDPNCPFFKKKVVITGVFSKISRQEIAKILKEKGADVDTSVTDKTNYIISGIEPGPSKIRKFEILKRSGHDINLLSETDFIDAIKDSTCGK